MAFALTEGLDETSRTRIQREAQAMGRQGFHPREANFRSLGDLRSFWSESVSSRNEEISLTWYDLGKPFLSHSFRGSNSGRPPGVSAVLIPVNGARLTVSGQRDRAHHGASDT